jgi:hypothetical protein
MIAIVIRLSERHSGMLDRRPSNLVAALLREHAARIPPGVSVDVHAQCWFTGIDAPPELQPLAEELLACAVRLAAQLQIPTDGMCVASPCGSHPPAPGHGWLVEVLGSNTLDTHTLWYSTECSALERLSLECSYYHVTPVTPASGWTTLCPDLRVRAFAV